MDTPRLARAITGSGHFIEACLDFLPSLNHVDTNIRQTGEEVLKLMAAAPGGKFCCIRAK